MAAADGPPSDDSAGRPVVAAGAVSSDLPLQTRVTFHAKFDEVQFGESVCVVGSHASLGAWNPDNCIVLCTSDEIFPSWVSAEALVIESFTHVEYKYLVKGQDGQVRCWESYTGNREFFTSGAEMAVEDDEGHYRQFVLQAEAEDEEVEQDTPPEWVSASMCACKHACMCSCKHARATVSMCAGVDEELRSVSWRRSVEHRCSETLDRRLCVSVSVCALVLELELVYIPIFAQVGSSELGIRTQKSRQAL